jgi:hypothetical protein
MDYNYNLPKDIFIRNYSDFNLIHRNETSSWTNYNDIKYSLHNGRWVFIREVHDGKDVHYVYWKANSPLLEYECYYESKAVDPMLTEYFTSVKEWYETISSIANADYYGYLKKKKEILRSLDYNNLEQHRLRRRNHYRPRLSWRYLNPKNEAYFEKIFSRYRP